MTLRRMTRKIRAEGSIDVTRTRGAEMPSKGEEERFLKGLAESMEKIKKYNQRAAEELSRTEEMLESIQGAREAEEA